MKYKNIVFLVFFPINAVLRSFVRNFQFEFQELVVGKFMVPQKLGRCREEDGGDLIGRLGHQRRRPIKRDLDQARFVRSQPIVRRPVRRVDEGYTSPNNKCQVSMYITD